MRNKLNRFKPLANKICQGFLNNKLVRFFRRQLREKPMFLALVSFCVSLPLGLYVTDSVFRSIFTWLYAVTQNVEINDLSEDYGFGMVGLLLSVFVFFLSLPILYFFIKKQLTRFSSYE